MRPAPPGSTGSQRDHATAVGPWTRGVYRRRAAALACFVLLAGLAGPTPAGRTVGGSAARAPRFETDVLPLFKSHCLRCHGGKARKGALGLDTLAQALKGGESGPALVPGKPEDSLLYQKVREGMMPPGKKDRLTAAEVDLIRRWIGAGATGDSTPKTSALEVTQHDVLPILLRRCTVCHGRQVREGNLDLRTRASMLRGGKSGPAIVPGRPGESLLLKKIRSGAMPPLSRIVEVSIKPIEPAETALLARWIERGAPEVHVEPDVATTRPDPLVTNRDRDFWAFRAPRPVPVPAVRAAGRARNPIDAFLLRRLEQKGLSLSPEADRAALLRRVCLDLTGLPPEPAELRAFLADRAPDAYERVVDRLLSSPRYGERWGRHWLDLAGYADSEGKREQDLPRPSAWRYRDYVIRSFNADKPYDRFLLEQIAGDELADHEHALEITPELYDDLVATGFLRMAPDPTWYNLTNFIPDRLEVVADEIDVLSSAVLGLTMKCARCHSHKFDPIPQRDYYRLLAVFKGAFDEHDWMKSNWDPGLSMGRRADRELPYVTTTERRAWAGRDAALTKAIAAARAALERRADELTRKYREARLAELPAELRDDLGAMLATPPARRTAVQAYLAGKFEKRLRVDRGELLRIDAGFRQQAEKTGRRVRDLEARRRPEPTVRALWDRGEPSPTYVYRRGDYLRPGRLVGPGVPSVLTDGRTPFVVTPPWPGSRKTGRRLAFARWLTSPGQPLTARVMVNRIWQHHFGRGLVSTPDNFGKAGARPTHPELLDYLAGEFVRRNWSVKALHRLMVTSAAYRQSSAVTPALKRLDPDNTLYSRMPLQRLSADQLYDTMLLVAGRLDETRYGPPDPVEVRSDGLVRPRPGPRGWRRSVYVQQQRKVVVTQLQLFDFPQMNPNCVKRRDSIVAPQALHLMNDGLVHRLADAFARRVGREAGTDPGRQVDAVYRIALSRPPDRAEREAGRADLARLAGHWARHLDRAGRSDAAEAARRALATYCHALLNSAEFLYVD